MEYTYEQYCDDLNIVENTLLTEGVADTLKGVPKNIMGFVKPLKQYFPDVSIKETMKAFKNTKVFGMLKYFGFSLKKMMSAINKGLQLVDKGLLKVIGQLHKTKTFQKIRKGIVKLDDVIDKHPILNRVTGVAVAGILVLIWLNMSFSGHFDGDMDLSSVFLALKGDFSLDDIFGSEAGNKMLLLLSTGLTTAGGLSFPWLIKSSANLAMALMYTFYKLSKSGHINMEEMKKRILRKKLEEGMQIKFKDYLNEVNSSAATNMETAIIEVWNGNGDSFKWTDKLKQENVERIVSQLKKKGLKGKGKQIGASSAGVTPQWAKYFEGGKVPGGTKTPKTDIVIGKDKISLKTGTSAQLMSGGKSESTATFYSAVDKMKTKDKAVMEVGKMLDQLITVNVATADMTTMKKTRENELVNKADALHKEIQAQFRTMFSSNDEFGYWFTREAMFGEVKFGGNIGTASDMLATSFDGTKLSYHPVSDTGYIKGISKRVKPVVRFKSVSVKKQVDGKKTKTGEYRYWSAVGLGLTKITEEFDALDGQMLTEGKLADIAKKVKNYLVGIFNKIKKWLKESISHVFQFLGIEPIVQYDNTVNFL